MVKTLFDAMVKNFFITMMPVEARGTQSLFPEMCVVKGWVCLDELPAKGTNSSAVYVQG